MSCILAPSTNIWQAFFLEQELCYFASFWVNFHISYGKLMVHKGIAIAFFSEEAV